MDRCEARRATLATSSLGRDSTGAQAGKSSIADGSMSIVTRRGISQSDHADR